MMFLQRVHRMMLSLGRDVGCVGFFGAVKGSKVNCFALHFNAGLPFSRPKLPCADKTRSAVASDSSLVLAIFSGRNISQVCNPVVVTNPVNVVNVTFGPDTVDVKPSEPVGAILSPLNADASVSLRGCDEASFGSCFGKLVACDAIGKNARFGVVMQKVFKLGLGDSISGFSHVIAPSQRWIGQRIEGVTSTFFPRFNIDGIA